MRKNEWGLTIEKDGEIVSHREGELSDFASLLKATDETRGAARVTFSYGVSKAYGEEKLSCTVSLNCDQSPATIFDAGYTSFNTAKALVEDAIKILERENTDAETR